MFDTDEREYGPLKAACERAAEAAMPGRVLVARAGVIVGPHENIGRLPWWLRRLAAGRRGARARAARRADAADRRARPRGLDARHGRGRQRRRLQRDRPAGLGDLGRAARGARCEVTGGRAELRWVDPALIEARVEEPWDALPLWPIPSLPGLYGMSGERAARAGLAPRPLRETIADTWAWLAAGGELDDWRSELRASGLSPRVASARCCLRS